MALTDTEIQKAKPKDKVYRMSDGGRMYRLVTPSSGKLWRWGYRFQGKEKLTALGKYPAVSLALARERHLEAKKLLATGTDPMRSGKSQRLPIRSRTKIPSQASR